MKLAKTTKIIIAIDLSLRTFLWIRDKDFGVTGVLWAVCWIAVYILLQRAYEYADRKLEQLESPTQVSEGTSTRRNVFATLWQFPTSAGKRLRKRSALVCAPLVLILLSGGWVGWYSYRSSAARNSNLRKLDETFKGHGYEVDDIRSTLEERRGGLEEKYGDLPSGFRYENPRSSLRAVLIVTGIISFGYLVIIGLMMSELLVSAPRLVILWASILVVIGFILAAPRYVQLRFGEHVKYLQERRFDEDIQPHVDWDWVAQRGLLVVLVAAGLLYTYTIQYRRKKP